VLVGIVEACHDSTLLVVTYSLLKEICLAPTPWQDSHEKPVTWLLELCMVACHPTCPWHSAIHSGMRYCMQQRLFDKREEDVLTVVKAAPSIQRGTWSCRSSHCPAHAAACQPQTQCTAPSTLHSCRSKPPASSKHS